MLSGTWDGTGHMWVHVQLDTVGEVARRVLYVTGRAHNGTLVLSVFALFFCVRLVSLFLSLSYICMCDRLPVAHPIVFEHSEKLE